jgi:NAD(P)-dependent dehydrogenase (short-subunit alcohol dehydrogenase family)
VNRLEGLRAVVIGVGSGIGRACAVAFAREGASLLAVDADRAVATDVAAEIQSKGGSAAAHHADSVSDAAAAGVAQRCDELWQRVDVLMTCEADMDFWASDDDDSVANWELVLRANLLGPSIYTKRLLPLLKRSAAGSIIYLGSIDGIRGNPNYPAYSVSKGGLTPLTHVMAWRCGAHGIRVNCIAAGAIDQTGSTSRPRFPPAGASNLSDSLRLTPLGRRANPEDIASVALFFASRDSAFVTGVVLPVDGGRTAITPGTGTMDPEAHQ